MDNSPGTIMPPGQEGQPPIFPVYGPAFGQPSQIQPQQTQPAVRVPTPRRELCNPCCCIELGRGVLIASIYLIVYFVASTIFYLVSLIVDFTVFVDARPRTIKIINIGFFSSLIGIAAAIVLTTSAIKKSTLLLRIGMGVHAIPYSFICCFNITFAMMTLAFSKNPSSLSQMGPILVWFIIDFGIHIYIQVVILTYFRQQRRIILMKAMIDRGGQFPVGPPPPLPNGQPLNYQPSVPTVGYSQTSLDPQAQK